MKGDVMDYLFAFLGVVAFLSSLKNLKDTDKLLREIEERQSHMIEDPEESSEESEVER